jgi:hypothetical protein
LRQVHELIFLHGALCRLDGAVHNEIGNGAALDFSRFLEQRFGDPAHARFQARPAPRRRSPFYDLHCLSPLSTKTVRTVFVIRLQCTANGRTSQSEKAPQPFIFNN